MVSEVISVEIRQLRSFIALADTLNFSRAADSVYLSQSSLSRQIAELEQEVGVPLFQRSTRKVELTPAGQMLQMQAKDLISRWEKLLPEIRKSSNMDVHPPTLTIGLDARAAADPVHRKNLTDLLTTLRQEYPGLRVLFYHYDYQQLVEGLSDRSLDCALILDREMEPPQNLRQEVLGQEEMVLVFRSARAYTGDQYAEVVLRRGLVLVDKEPQGLYHIIRILSDLGLEPQIRFCESLSDMTMTVETGESAMILPESVVKKLNNPALQVLRLPTPYAVLQHAMYWSENNDNPMLEVFRARIQQL